MKKRPPSGARLPVSNPSPQKTVLNWRNIPERDLCFHARSFHKAAKTLAGSLRRPFTDSDVSPIVFTYRHALELHLKALLLGDGANFLATKLDALSVHKTHSVCWLAQFVCQIVTAVKWEKEFKCEGIETFADFTAAIEELSVVDPGSYVFRLPISAESQESVPGRVNLTMRDFARRMDALLELLDSTADALAAEWDMRSDAAAIEADWNSGGFEPPIQ